MYILFRERIALRTEKGRLLQRGDRLSWGWEFGAIKRAEPRGEVGTATIHCGKYML